MGDKYKFVGHVDSANRPDRIQVTETKVLVLGGDPVSLTDAQVHAVSAHGVLEKVVDDEPDEEAVVPDSTTSPKTSAASGSGSSSEKGK